MCISATEICHTPGISSTLCGTCNFEIESLVMHVHPWSDSLTHTYTTHNAYTHAYAHNTRPHQHACTYVQHTLIDIILTDVKQDGSETGHSKEKNDYYQYNTECSHSWSLIGTFWTRPCGVGFKVNDKHESIWLTVWEIGYKEIGYNTPIVVHVQYYTATPTV